MVLLDKIEKDYDLFDFIFEEIGGKAKNLQNGKIIIIKLSKECL